MFHVLSVVRLILRDNRFRAQLRREYPLLDVVAFFVLGQAGGWYVAVAFGWWWGVAVSSALLIGNVFLGRLLWVALGVFSISITSFVPHYPENVSKNYLGVIASNPRHSRVGGISLNLELYPLLDTTSRRPVRATCVAPHLPWRWISDMRRGDITIVVVEFRPLRPSPNPFSWYRKQVAERVDAQCKVRWASRSLGRSPSYTTSLGAAVRAEVERVLGVNEVSGLLLSMAFGLRDTFSEETEKDFLATGLTHLLVLSGFQVTLLYASICFLLRGALMICLRARFSEPLQRIAPSGALLLVVFFLLRLGIEDAGSRAVLSAIFTFISVWNERGVTFLNIVIVSAFACSLVWPGSLCGVGMQLTFAALLGIIVGRTTKTGWLLIRFCAVTLYTSLFTSLVCLLWFGTLSFIGIIANGIIGPIASIVGTQAGLFAWLAHTLGIDPNGYLLVLVSLLLSFVKDCVQRLATVSGGISVLKEGEWYSGVILLSLLALRVLLLRVYEWAQSRGLVHCESSL